MAYGCTVAASVWTGDADRTKVSLSGGPNKSLGSRDTKLLSCKATVTSASRRASGGISFGCRIQVRPKTKRGGFAGFKSRNKVKGRFKAYYNYPSKLTDLY